MKRVLSIAGSDSGGGAGVQADLKTLLALGVHGMSAVTALTAQNSLGVSQVWPVPAAVVAAQLESVLSDIGADAVKTGLLPDPEVVDVVVAALRRHAALRGHRVPLVVDPVGVSSSGRRLRSPATLAALRDRLLPITTVLTPNLAEVAELTGVEVAEESHLPAAARALLELGPRWVLVKGGHLPGRPVDLLAGPGELVWLAGERLAQPNTHGTGCTLASALAAFLARGAQVPVAARRAKEFVTGAIAAGYPLGAGVGPVQPGWAAFGGPAGPRPD